MTGNNALHMLCLFGPSSREMRTFCRPELQSLYERELQNSHSAPGPCKLQWDTLHDTPDFRLDWVSHADGDALCRAAGSSAILTALIEVQANAPTLDAAVDQVFSCCPGPWSHPHSDLRAVVLGSRHSKTSGERHLRRQLQQRLGSPPEEAAGVGTSTGRSRGLSQHKTTLWAIELQSQQEAATSSAAAAAAAAADGVSGGQAPAWCSRVLLGVELARGGAALAGLRRGRGQAGGGPTQMRPELALASANLAALPRGALVLDPFCGTGTLLEAAAAAAAGFALGSDMDPCPLSSSSSSSSSTGGSACLDTLAADAGGLRLRAGTLDAIVCDLPYGHRAHVRVAASPAGAPTNTAGAPASSASLSGPEEACRGSSTPAWKQLLAALLRLGGHALAPGGRLVVWMPHGGPTAAHASEGQLGDHSGRPGACSPLAAAWGPGTAECSSGRAGPHAAAAAAGGYAISEAATSSGPDHGIKGAGTGQQSWLGQLGSENGLQLLYYMPETRQKGFPRAVAVLQKGARDAAAGAPASGARVGSSCQQHQPLLQQQGDGPAAAAAVATAAVTTQSQPSDPLAREKRSKDSLQQTRVQRAEPAGDARAAMLGLGWTQEQQQQWGEKESHGGRAGLRRDLRYTETRATLQGRDIDVWRASWLGDTASIWSYLDAGGDVNARDSKGQTALQFASGYGKAAAVELLLQAGVDAGLAGDKERMAPLHRAAARGHTAVVALLLRHGANPCQLSAAGQTPLMYAAQFGHQGALAALMEPRWLSAASSEAEAAAAPQHSATAGAPAASAAAAGSPEGCSSGVRSSGADWGALKAYAAMVDGSGLTALHLAAQWGMAQVARDMILGPQASCKPGPCSGQGEGPGSAAGQPSEATGEPPHQGLLAGTSSFPLQLLRASWIADPNCRTANEEGLTPAHLAARWGHVGMLQVLRTLGADLQMPCLGKERTPLQEAREWTRPACIEFLSSL